MAETAELERFSDNRSTDVLRDRLVIAEAEGLDLDMFALDNAGVENEKPQSVFNVGSPVRTASGDTADAAAADLMACRARSRIGLSPALAVGIGSVRVLDVPMNSPQNSHVLRTVKPDLSV